MSLREVREDPHIAKRGRFAVPQFCGWNSLQEYHSRCPTEEVAGLFAVLFETGCRVSEALKLRGDMFVEDDDTWLTVYRAPVLKKKEYAPLADRFRNIPILRSEPLVEPMMNYVEGRPGSLFQRGRVWAWMQIVGVDDRWWPHRIRSERATQLHTEYGYEVPELMKFFNWSEPKEALEYVRLGTSDLKEKVLKSRN